MTPVAITDNMPPAKARVHLGVVPMGRKRYQNTSAPARSVSSVLSMPLPAYLLDTTD
jgi:hypothetical protein